MSIAAGSFAFKRFQLVSQTKFVNLAWIVEHLKKSLISPLDLDDTREESIGFCHPYTGESKIDDVHSLVYENSFVFGFRRDKKKIPATYMKMQLKAAFDSLEKQEKNSAGGKTRISKKVRDAVKDRLKEELLRSVLPSIRVSEIIWHLDSRQIFLCSASSQVVSEFSQLFTETFALPFVELNAGTLNVDFESLQLGLPVNLKSLLEIQPAFMLPLEKKQSSAKISEEIVSVF